jgi:predicted glycoside hydrolase/deacetylase ChbG (UPF0249 family)
MERLLIINADDYGFTSGVNEGIIQAHAEGVVSSTSVMVRERAAGEAGALKEYPELSVGLHFQIGDKALEAAVRAGEQLSPEDITALKADFAAQLDLFRELAGAEPTHIDGHYSVHLHPDVVPLLDEYCRDRGIPRRGIDAAFIKEYFAWDASGAKDVERVSPEALLAIIDELGEGINELMCHPGLADDELRSVSRYVEERQIEVGTLTDLRVLERFEQADIELINWSDPRIQKSQLGV